MLRQNEIDSLLCSNNQSVPEKALSNARTVNLQLRVETESAEHANPDIVPNHDCSVIASPQVLVDIDEESQLSKDHGDINGTQHRAFVERPSLHWQPLYWKIVKC